MWGRANEWTALVEHAVVDDERLEADDGVARRQTAVERRVEGDDAVGVRAALTALDDDGCRVWVFVGVTTTSRGRVRARGSVGSGQTADMLLLWGLHVGVGRLVLWHGSRA